MTRRSNPGTPERPGQRPGPRSARLRLMRACHAACRALKLDDDARHDVQLAVTGHASMRDMNNNDLARLLAHLNRRTGYGTRRRRTGGHAGAKTGAQTDAQTGAQTGAEPGAAARHHSHPYPHPVAPRADLRLIHALWGELGRRGALTRPGRAGLNAFIRARFEGHWTFVPIDVDALREARRINDVIRALRAMLARAGNSAGEQGGGGA